jgi:hypothetical protein
MAIPWRLSGDDSSSSDELQRSASLEISYRAVGALQARAANSRRQKALQRRALRLHHQNERACARHRFLEGCSRLSFTHFCCRAGVKLSKARCWHVTPRWRNFARSVRDRINAGERRVDPFALRIDDNSITTGNAVRLFRKTLRLFI